MHLQLLYGLQFLQYLHTMYMAKEKSCPVEMFLGSVIEMQVISGKNLNLREGVQLTKLRSCCGVFWHGKKIGTSQTSPKSSQKRLVSIIIPGYSVLFPAIGDPSRCKQGCSLLAAQYGAKAIAFAFQLLMVCGHQESSLMVGLLPDSVDKCQ